MHSLISIITPFHNSEAYLEQAVNSVLHQSYPNWELLLINDGSLDRSEKIVRSFQDDRVKYFKQPNRGVSSARNLGLSHMKGDYFCFLDSDDYLPENSLESRLDVFKRNPETDFVDGTVLKKDNTLEKTIEIWKPSLKGNPISDLISLEGKTFFGLSWMFRRQRENLYTFKEGLTHCEDLLFCLEQAKNNGLYSYTNDVILHYRIRYNSAMSNLGGLSKGYQSVYDYLKIQPEISGVLLQQYKSKVHKILFKSYLREVRLLKAFTFRLS